MKIKTTNTKVQKEDLYACPRCKITSEGTQMCPCPRGSCEAEVVAKKIVTTVTTFVPLKPKGKTTKTPIVTFA
jgi:hypothetical protein